MLPKDTNKTTSVFRVTLLIVTTVAMFFSMAISSLIFLITFSVAGGNFGPIVLILGVLFLVYIVGLEIFQRLEFVSLDKIKPFKTFMTGFVAILVAGLLLYIEAKGAGILSSEARPGRTPSGAAPVFGLAFGYGAVYLAVRSYFVQMLGKR